MSFELKVEFVGLCMFVPVTDPGPAAMHVLLPVAGHDHDDHEVEQHVGMLCFDDAYLKPDATATSSGLMLEDMNGRQLVLAGVGETRPALIEGLVDLGKVTGASVDAGALRENGSTSKLTARVVVKSGEYSGCASGVCWKFPNRQLIPNRVFWTIQIDAARLDLELTSLEGELSKTLHLYPINGAIGISVYNTPQDELPPDPVLVGPPERGTEAHHFAAYYELFTPPLAEKPLPTFYGTGCGPTDEPGASPYTCMVAQSLPVPPAPGV